MQLSRPYFLVLRTMAGGPQAFSTVFEDAGARLGKTTLVSVAEALCDLVDARLVQRDGAPDDGTETALLREIVSHYAGLPTELAHGKRPFWYSRGEMFFALTPEGKKAAGDPRYATWV